MQNLTPKQINRLSIFAPNYDGDGTAPHCAMLADAESNVAEIHLVGFDPSATNNSASRDARTTMDSIVSLWGTGQFYPSIDGTKILVLGRPVATIRYI